MSLCSLLLGDVWLHWVLVLQSCHFIDFLSFQAGEFIPLLLLHLKGQCSKEDPGEDCKGWGHCLSGGVLGRWVTEDHTAAVCLMLWKLILVGDVGMDMARATGTWRAWWSCQRCHRFLRAERTCREGEPPVFAIPYPHLKNY